MYDLLRKILKNNTPSKLTKKFSNFSTYNGQINKDFQSNSLSSSSTNLVQEGIIAGKKIAQISVITLLSIGIVEIVAGYYSGSNVATADGIDSLSDAFISFIVLIGLRIAHKPADRKFHFGYHKVESFAAFLAAIGMIVIGVVIFYNSYQALIHPHEINHPYITMAMTSRS